MTTQNIARPTPVYHSAVSRAFATLSDPEKRRHYDVYGADEPRVMRRTPSHPEGFDEFDPDYIFQMFFNGAFPGGCVLF